MKKILTCGLVFLFSYTFSQETNMVRLFPYSAELEDVKVADSLYQAHQDSLADILNEQLQRRNTSKSSYKPFKNLEEEYEEHILPIISPILYPNLFPKHPEVRIELRSLSEDNIRYKLKYSWERHYLRKQNEKKREKLRYLDSINDLYIRYRKKESGLK